MSMETLEKMNLRLRRIFRGEEHSATVLPLTRRAGFG
jgi:hypothetical protein